MTTSLKTLAIAFIAFSGTFLLQAKTNAIGFDKEIASLYIEYDEGFVDFTFHHRSDDNGIPFHEEVIHFRDLVDFLAVAEPDEKMDQVSLLIKLVEKAGYQKLSRHPVYGNSGSRKGKADELLGWYLVFTKPVDNDT